MRVRYTINKAGELVTKDGVSLGRITSITIERPEPVEPAATPAEEAALPSPVLAVWERYVAAMKPRHKTLDAERRRVIQGALKVATVEECQRAIAGCLASDWHMGRDPQTSGRTYKQLSHILKGKRGGRTTREQIDFFIELADRASGQPQVDAARLQRAKAAVLAAWEFPRDERAQVVGAAARKWLAEHGVDVLYSFNDRPTFVPREGS